MVTRYRLVKRNELYYPQVQFKVFLFWGFWKRIGVHPDGYGLYHSSYFDYGVDESMAKKIIEDFKSWNYNQSNPTIEYNNL